MTTLDQLKQEAVRHCGECDDTTVCPQHKYEIRMLEKAYQAGQEDEGVVLFGYDAGYRAGLLRGAEIVMEHSKEVDDKYLVAAIEVIAEDLEKKAEQL